MSQLEPYQLTAADIGRRVRSGDLRVRDVVEFYWQRTEALAPELGSHLYFDRSTIEAQVLDVERRLLQNSALPLAGVPVVVKDNICTVDMPTTCASRILTGFHPPYDAEVVTRLRRAGAIIMGKANCDEFAMGSTNETSAFGPARNPWDLRRSPGGSSGGSAAAVAADLAPVALGSDTGGSIRQPASLCGIVGFKPTYGHVSRYGLVAYGSSLDQIGPMARSVEDAALLYDVIGGHDPKDSTSLNVALAPTASHLVRSRAKGLRLGLIEELWGDGLSEQVRTALDQAVSVFKGLGATVVPISLPSLRFAIPAYYVVATAEASTNLSRYDGVRYGQRHGGEAGLTGLYRKTRSLGFGLEVKQRLMLGTFALSAGYYDAYYAKALRARAYLRADCRRAFSQVDLLLAPAWPTTAFPIGAVEEDPVALYLSDICTVPANLAGLPAISVPAGYDQGGLPVGLQLMGAAGEDSLVLAGAHWYEQSTLWGQRVHPKL